MSVWLPNVCFFLSLRASVCEDASEMGAGLQGHMVSVHPLLLLLIYFGLLSFPFRLILHFLVPARCFHPPLAVILDPSSSRNIPSGFTMERTFEFHCRSVDDPEALISSFDLLRSKFRILQHGALP